MTTKTFSGRANADSLAFADSLVHERYGMSFGKYCGSVLLSAIERSGKMPELPEADDNSEIKRNAIAYIKGFSSGRHDASIGKMTDEQIRDLVASRYE